MKKWLKWILGILATIILAVVIFTAWNWDSLTILMGTEGVSEEAVAAPETAGNITNLLEKGPADWPSWYGPDGEKIAKVKNIKTDWSKGLHKLWEVNYLCQGNTSATWSAPVIQGDRLVVSGRDEENDLLFCINITNSKLIWKGSYPVSPESSHGAGPRATPFIDHDRVYTFGRNGDLVCWRLDDGALIWHSNVKDEGGKEPTWGFSSSPLIYKNLVIVQAGGTCRTIAYDKMLGEVAWKSGEGLAGYAAPKIMKVGQDTILLAFHGKGLAALTVDTGNQLWNIDWPTDYDVNATTPLVLEEQAFITSGYGTGSLMLHVSRAAADSVWGNAAFASQHSDPYVIGDYIYGYSGDSFQNKGAFICLDSETGQTKWRTNDMGWGTCLLADNYLICLDIKGNLFLMKPDPEQVVILGSIESALGDIRGPVWTMPIAANGKLFLRFKHKLVCYEIS